MEQQRPQRLGPLRCPRSQERVAWRHDSPATSLDPLPDGSAVTAAAADPALRVFDWPLPPERPRVGSVLLVHGFGEHLDRYADVAASLNDLGLHVRGYDARGHGRSPGPRGVIRDPSALLEDLARMFERLSFDAAKAGDEAPPFVLAHSLGALLAARAATSGTIAPRGLILSAPPFAVSLPLYRRLGVAVGLRLFPDRAVPNGQPERAISHDPDAVARALADPLVHDRITLRLVRFVQDTADQTIRDAPHLRTPTLLLVAGADRHVNPAGAQAFFDALPAGTGTLCWYDELYHELFQEREPDRTRVLADMRSWLEGQLAQTASGFPDSEGRSYRV